MLYEEKSLVSVFFQFLLQYKRLLRDRDSMWEAADVEIKETYGKEYFFAQYERLAHLTSSYPNCNPVSDAIEDALMNENPAARYLVAGGVGLYDDCVRVSCLHLFSYAKFVTGLEIKYFL